MIKKELVEVVPTGKQASYYRDLGYLVTARKSLMVSSLDVPEKSNIVITRICCDCGDEKKMRRVKAGERCLSCSSAYNSTSRKDISKTTCPKCGKHKSYSAKTCQACVDMSGENNPMYGKPSHFSELNLFRSPEEHWNWKSGISEGRCSKMISWAKKVKADAVCDCCGFTDERALDAHHLEGYDTFPLLRYEVSNGVCLCKNCHTIFHKTYGFGNNTKEQYLAFKESYK